MIRSIRRAAVIGSGSMGGALAAHIANAGIPVHLLDIVPDRLTSEEEKAGLDFTHPAVRNRIVSAGLAQVRKSKPAALFTPEVADLINVGNLEDNLDLLREADWVVEAVVENLGVKREVMGRIEAVRKAGSIVSSNTSGIPIASIAAGRSADFKAHCLGTHFYNPPRYLRLLEIIPTEDTLREVTQFMVDFGERVLGKGVVVCKDRPNFLAGRLFTLESSFAIAYAVENGYTVEEVDAITGPLIGQPKTGTFRRIDIAGLDIALQVAENLYQALPDDEEREYFKAPDIYGTLVNRGWLGDKKGQGFYKASTGAGQKELLVLDLQSLEYRPAQKVDLETVIEASKIISLPERLRFLVNVEDRVGKFLWTTLSRPLAYAAMRIPEIADNIVDVDNAIKWGFSRRMGPFEIWDALGIASSVQRMESEGLAIAPWVKEMLALGNETFYKRQNGQLLYYDLETKRHRPRPSRPEFVLIRDLRERGKELKANSGASLIDMGDGVLLLEFHSKANTLDSDIVAMIFEGVRELEEDPNREALVIGSQGNNFCVGGNLAPVYDAAQKGDFAEIDRLLKEAQDGVMALRFCSKPVIAAPFGRVLGGGAEVAMGASCIVAAAETYMGLTEVAVGLLPSAGGCKELLRRLVSPPALMAADLDVYPLLQKIFEVVVKAKTSTSAEEARRMGFLTPFDRVVMNRDLLLHEAKRTALYLAQSSYRPPTRTSSIYAMGSRGVVNLNRRIHERLDGECLSEHDVKIAQKIAYVLSGGELTAPQWVHEQHILDLEREAFVSLCREPETLERIGNMLRIGKPSCLQERDH